MHNLFKNKSALDFLLLAVCLALLIGCLGRREIDGVRERRLAATAADVDFHGHWLLPEMAGEARFLKPPYADWLSVCSMRLLGRNEFAFRLPFALAGLGMMGLAWALGKRLVSGEAGLLAATMLATMIWFAGECESASQDLYLGLFTAAALLSWVRWQESPVPWSRAWWCFWLSLTGACLFKGPVALAVVGIPIALELWARRVGSHAIALRPWWGMMLVLAVALIWPLTVWLIVPDFPQKLLADMKISLVKEDGVPGGSRFNHVINLAWNTFPWTVLAFASVMMPLFRRALPEWPKVRLCYFWFVGNFVFFSTWARQPKHYLLPLMVPLVVLQATLCLRLIRAPQYRAGWFAKLAAVVLALSFAGLAAPLVTMLHTRGGLSWIATGGIIASVVLPVILALVWTGQPQRFLRALIASGVVTIAIYCAIIWPDQSRRETVAGFAKAVAAQVPSSEPVFFTGMNESMPFYVRRDFRKLDASQQRATLLQIGKGYLLTSRSNSRLLSVSVDGLAFEPLVTEINKRKNNEADMVLIHFTKP